MTIIQYRDIIEVYQIGIGGIVMADKKPVTPRSNDEKQAVVNRLKRIEGQVRGIQKMIEEDRYCIDILVQLSAIDSALKQVGYSVTERHMKHCISHAVKENQGPEAIDELMNVLKQYSK